MNAIERAAADRTDGAAALQPLRPTTMSGPVLATPQAVVAAPTAQITFGPGALDIGGPLAVADLSNDTALGIETVDARALLRLRKSALR